MGVDNFSNMLMIFATLALLGKGIITFISKNPVGFSNDEKNIKASELTDVQKWNRGHAMIWFGYAVAVLLGYGIETLMGENPWSVLPFFVGVFVPIPLMMKYHKKLVELYKK